jgi:gliding motility-associated-like protein
MNNLTRFLLLLATCFFIVGNIKATHLIGGNLGYEYIGPVGNMFRYKIVFSTFTNCDNTSQIPFPENPLTIGVYYHDNANPDAIKQRYTTVTVNLVDTNLIKPALPNNCTVGQETCIIEGIYEGFVNLPFNLSGYHLFYERCCRNGGIVNLINPGDQANAFYAYIPSTLVKNSSPSFTDLPTPFICVGDTVSILNTAIDPDGDLLVFSFVLPYNGFSSSANPAPAPPNPLNWPIPGVNYVAGFSENQPFGANGYSYINASTGLTSYKIPNIGKYVIAVEIKEYRNGNLIGISRRDLQLLSISCPANASPNPAPSSIQTNYKLEEGQTLCFPITFTDQDGHQVEITSSGEVFNPSFVNPPATINTPVTGNGNVTANFCWTTACGQARPLPYLFNVSATDNGCPPKTTNQVYSIQVDPVPVPASVSGPSIVCENSSTTYTTPQTGSFTYSWAVSGGVITSGGTSNGITVQWGAAGAGQVSVTAVNTFGCSSQPFIYNVTIITSPTANAGLDNIICAGQGIQIGGSPTGAPGSSYTWSPSTGLNSTTLPNPVANPATTTTYTVTVSNGSSCYGLDSVTVVVNSVIASAGLDVAICQGDSMQLIASGGISYTWSPSSGLSNTGIPDPIAMPGSTITYFVTVSDISGCTGIDSVTVSVKDLPLADAGADTAICSGSSIIVGGAPTGTTGSSFSWFPPSSLSDTAIANPVANPATGTTYIVVVEKDGCYTQDSIKIIVYDIPSVNAESDTLICFGDTIQLFATGGVSFQWFPVAGLSNSLVSAPLASPSSNTVYYVTIADTNTCSNIDSVVVLVRDLPPADAGPDMAFCIGDSIMLNASGGGDYLWSPAMGLSDISIPNPVANPPSTTEYILTVTDNIGCSDTSKVTVTVNEIPIVDAGRDTTVCSGEQLVIGGAPTGPPGSVFTWNSSTALNDSTISNPVATPMVTGTFIVFLSDVNGCQNSDTLEIMVNPLPIADAGQDETLCLRDTVWLSASGGVNYSWFPSTGISDYSIADPYAFPAQTTVYQVTVTDTNGCVNADSILVDVKPLPPADAGPDLWLCPGDNSILSATGGTIYSWSPGIGLSDPLISNPTVTLTDTTTYIVTVTDGNGCSEKDTIKVIVNQVVPTSAGLDAVICPGDTVMIGGFPTSPLGTVFTWSPVTFLDDPNISNPKAFPPVTTKFYVFTTNDTCSGFDSVTVFVYQPTVADAGQDETICFGDTAQLSATGGVSYIWSPITGLSDPFVSNPFANPGSTINYHVAVIDTNGCFGFDSLTLTVNPLPFAEAGENGEICFNDSIQLVANGGISYNWYPPAGLNDTSIADPWAKPFLGIMYYVVVTDTNQCSNLDSVFIKVNELPVVDAGEDVSICIGDSINLNATGGIVYAWFPPSGLNDTTIHNPWAGPSLETVYHVIVSDSIGCRNSDSLMVSVNPLPVVSAGNDGHFCIGDSIQLNASGGNIYFWSPSIGLSNVNVSDPWAAPGTTTLYFVSAIDSNSCSNSDSVLIRVDDIPIIVAGPDIKICFGDTVFLNATGGFNYLWSPQEDIINPETASPGVFPSNNFIYYVTGIDTNGCSNTDSVTVNVFRATVSADTLMCSGDTVQISAAGPGAISYSWFPAASLNNSTVQSPLAFPNGTTVYSVIVGDGQCEDTGNVTVAVNEKPEAVFDYELKADCNGILVEMNNKSTNSDSFKWEFGDGSNSIEFAPSHVFSYNSPFTITLIAENDNCFDSFTVQEDVKSFEDYFKIIVPNVFTPNNDGINDEFKINVTEELLDCFTLSVYNRWGRLMFKSEGNNYFWDGTAKSGAKVPQGAYYYIIDIRGKQYNGHLTIFD